MRSLLRIPRTSFFAHVLIDIVRLLQKGSSPREFFRATSHLKSLRPVGRSGSTPIHRTRRSNPKPRLCRLFIQLPSQNGKRPAQNGSERIDSRQRLCRGCLRALRNPCETAPVRSPSALPPLSFSCRGSWISRAPFASRFDVAPWRDPGCPCLRGRPSRSTLPRPRPGPPRASSAA